MATRETVEWLDGLMREFGLAEATVARDGAEVTFRRRLAVTISAPLTAQAPVAEGELETEPEPEPEPEPEVPSGTLVGSPMGGIFYAAPSPGAAPFVRVGDDLSTGQPVGLIEAMKVFNEIPSPVSGKVVEVIAKTGALLSLGDPLLRIA